MVTLSSSYVEENNLSPKLIDAKIKVYYERFSDGAILRCKGPHKAFLGLPPTTVVRHPHRGSGEIVYEVVDYNKPFPVCSACGAKAKVYGAKFDGVTYAHLKLADESKEYYNFSILHPRDVLIKASKVSKRKVDNFVYDVFNGQFYFEVFDIDITNSRRILIMKELIPVVGEKYFKKLGSRIAIGRVIKQANLDNK